MLQLSNHPVAAALLFGTLSAVVVTISASLYICTQRVLITGKVGHAAAGKRLWQAIYPPQIFAALCIAVVLWYEWTRLQSASNVADKLNDASAMQACRAVFWLSHLTPSFYALPYIQRGLRMVVLFDTGLRRKYRSLTSLWTHVLIFSVVNALSAGIAALFLVLNPARLEATECFFYEDWIYFIAQLVFYAGAVMILLRSIISRRIKDQYKITTELLSCFSSWVLLAGTHFLYAFVSTQVPAVADAERHVPSHYLLVVMFSFTSFQSWFRPFLLSSTTLHKTPRVRLLETQSKRLSFGLQALRAAARRTQAWSSHLARRRLSAEQSRSSQRGGIVAEHHQLLLQGASDPPLHTVAALRSASEEAHLGGEQSHSALQRSSTADSGTPHSPHRLPAPPPSERPPAGVALVSRVAQGSTEGGASSPALPQASSNPVSVDTFESDVLLSHSATASPVGAIARSTSPTSNGPKGAGSGSAAKTKQGSLSVDNYRRQPPGRGGLPPLSSSAVAGRPSLERQRSGSVPVAPSGLVSLPAGGVAIRAGHTHEELGSSHTRESVLPDEVRSALQQGPVPGKGGVSSPLAPGIRSKRGGTAAPDRGNQLWRDLLGMTKGRTTVRPYRVLPVFVPCAVCGPHDVIAWWLWHACGCTERRPCCGGTALHQEVNMRTFVNDPSVDGLPCGSSSTSHSCARCMLAAFCCGRGGRKRSSAVYTSGSSSALDSTAIAITAESTSIDDSAAVVLSPDGDSVHSAGSSHGVGTDSASGGTDGSEIWRPPAQTPPFALGCCGRVCARHWLADPHAFAATSVLWRGALGISASAPGGFCRPICGCSGARDDENGDGDSEEAALQRSTSSSLDADSRESAAVALFGRGPFGAAPPLAAALGRRGFLSLLSADPKRSASSAVDKIILQEFTQALPSAAHKVLRAALRATAAAEVEMAASATSGSSGDDAPGSGDESEDSSGSALALQRAAQAQQQYGGAVVSLVAKLLCVDLGPPTAGGSDGHAAEGGAGRGKEDQAATLQSMMAAARAAQAGQPDVDGVYGVELATTPLSASALARVQDASPSTLGTLWTLPKLLMHPIACAILREHSKACLCPELLDFVVAVRETKRRLLNARRRVAQAWGELLAAQVAAGNPPLHPYAQPSASAALLVWLGLGGARGTVPSAAADTKPRSKRAARGGKAAARVEFIAGFGMFAPKYSPLVQTTKRKVARIPGGNRQLRSGTTTDSELLALSASGGGSTSMYSATGLQDSTILSYSPAGNQDGMMPAPGSPTAAAAGSAASPAPPPQTHGGRAMEPAGRGSSTLIDGHGGVGSVSTYASSAASSAEHVQNTRSDFSAVSAPGLAPPGSSTGSDSKPTQPSQRTMSGRSSAGSQASVVSDVLQPDLYAHALTSLQQGLEGDATLQFKQLFKSGANTSENTLQLVRERPAARPSGGSDGTGGSAPSSGGDAMHVVLPQLDAPSIVELVNKLHAVFLQPGAPLEINISNAMRSRLEHDLHSVLSPSESTRGNPHAELAFAQPAVPKSAVAQRKLSAYISAPSPSTLAELAAAWEGFERANSSRAREHDSNASVAAATALLQVSFDTITRLACVFDDVALEIMKLLDENVVSSLPQSDVGKRLTLVRFRQRAARRRRKSLLLSHHSSSQDGSGGSGLFRGGPLRSAGKRSHKSSSSGSGTGGSGTGGSGSGIAPPPTPPV